MLVFEGPIRAELKRKIEKHGWLDNNPWINKCGQHTHTHTRLSSTTRADLLNPEHLLTLYWARSGECISSILVTQPLAHAANTKYALIKTVQRWLLCSVVMENLGQRRNKKVKTKTYILRQNVSLFRLFIWGTGFLKKISLSAQFFARLWNLKQHKYHKRNAIKSALNEAYRMF